MGGKETVTKIEYMPPIVADCLRMNKSPNKHKVLIRKKIAHYFFTKDFDIFPFSKMSISLQLMVLAMIEGNTLTVRLSAIFTLLKRILDLCKISSRAIIGLANNKQEYGGNFCVKRMKTD